MKKYIFSLVAISVFIVPFVAFGATIFDSNTLGGNQGQSSNINNVSTTYNANATCQTPQDLAGIFSYTLCLLTFYVTPFLFGLAGVVFIVGVLNYVRAGDNEEKRAAGRDLMWFGIIALFVMLCVWGFVNILSRSIFGKNSEMPNLPRQATSVFQQ